MMSNGSQQMKVTVVYKKEKDEFGKIAVFIRTNDDIDE